MASCCAAPAVSTHQQATRHRIAATTWASPHAPAAYHPGVIEMRLSIDDVSRTRFAYSPLAEVTESLYRLLPGRLHPLHEPWLHCAQDALRHVDLDLLTAVIPARPAMASFLFVGAESPSTTMEQQLQTLLALPAEEIRAELAEVWADDPPPQGARRVMQHPGPGARQIADALWGFWERAVAPHWPRIRSLLDDDLAHRTARLTSGGYSDLLNGLHPEVTVAGGSLRVAKGSDFVRDSSGEGLLLVPSVFTWPNLVVSTTTPGQARLIYGARGIARLWEHDHHLDADDDPIGALLGRTRAAILRRLDLPHSTTQLAHALGQSPGAISQHLSVLRRTALVTSRRAGRRMLSQRTPLATSLLHASHAPNATNATNATNDDDDAGAGVRR